jgi:hypothetical protein
LKVWTFKTSCYTAWDYLKNQPPGSVSVLDNSGNIDSRAIEFPFKTESSLDNLHAVIAIFHPREDEIDLTDDASWKDWTLSDGKRHKAFVLAVETVNVPRELIQLPPPPRSCFPCPHGFFMRPLNRLAVDKDGKIFTVMEKKEKFLEAIRKVVYNDNAWEDKAARYVSWLEPESLDDVDSIGHCQECPAGTSFEDLQVTDWDSSAKIPAFLTEAMKTDNTPLIKTWKKWHLPCFPCREGHYREAAQSNECQPCDDGHAVYTRTAVYIRTKHPDVTEHVQNIDSNQLQYTFQRGV